MQGANSNSKMQHSQSEVVLGTQNSSWSNLKEAEGMRKRSNTAQNLQYYVEEQKRLYRELPFLALPGMRCESFQRQRSSSNLRTKSSWGSFQNLVQRGEEKPLIGDDGRGFEDPGLTFPLLFSCMTAMLSAFQFGYNTGVMGALPTQLIFPGHSSLQWSIAVAIFAIGGPFGAMIAGEMATRFGRKRSLLFTSGIFVLAGAIMGLAPTIHVLIFGRFLVGFACGAATVIVPLYLGELAPPNLRGALGTGYQFAVVMGILTADLLAFPFAIPANGLFQPGWRLLLGFPLIPAIAQLLLSSFLIESPRWLLSRNSPTVAADILRKLRGTTDIYDEIDSICAASDQETSNMTVLQVLQDKSIRYPLLVGIALQMAQQLSGINAVFFYANSFFERVGLSNPLVGTTFVGAVNVVSTGVALILMDRAGRRILLLWSSMGMLLSALAITIALMKILPSGDVIAVGAMMSYVWFFEIGLGPIPWLIVAEMFPAKPRSTAMSIATVINWICSFIIGLVFPYLQIFLGNCSFLPFAGVLVLSYTFVFFCVPETKGKTLEEIQKELAEKDV